MMNRAAPLLLVVTVLMRATLGGSLSSLSYCPHQRKSLVRGLLLVLPRLLPELLPRLLLQLVLRPSPQ